ncbi:hypothetical protein YTPLAS18_12210 [Nitrospira sp.]|nr:hypothetical protein YTPLAS18_12210 [Nitrospira sp.]
MSPTDPKCYGSLLLFASVVLSGSGWAHAIDISGDYRYSFHPPETVAEATDHACREARRAAVGRSVTFREATAALVDSGFTRRLLEAVSQEGVTDAEVVQQSERGTTVSCTVKGRLDQEAMNRILLAQLQADPGPDQTTPDQNRALKLLRVEDDQAGQLIVEFQARRRLDWLNTAYPGSLREEANIMVEFYDAYGRLIAQSRYPARKTETGEDVMTPGEVGSLTIIKPAAAKSYRVWVPN